VQNPIIAALDQASRSRGNAPMITWYEPSSGARTELSVRSFANWVDKTANLLTAWDATGEVVAGAVNRDHPGHWMSLIWPLAAWQAGCAYSTEASTTAAVQVIGPEQPAAVPSRITVACSLHPLGLGLRGLPADVLDYSSEALAQPDAHHPASVEPDDPAWVDAAGVRSHAGLNVAPVSERVLVRPSQPWQALTDSIIAPLLGGGSAVIVEGEIDPEALARLVASERITTPVA
jgi:uncharacterized protein (TIGR03089 family)